MSDPFIGEVQIFGFSFPPTHWAACTGSTLAIQQNTTLFALIGNSYGGDGVRTFQLPNLSARAAMGYGTGRGVTTRVIGQTVGENEVALLQSQIPLHAHTMTAFSGGDPASHVGTPTQDAGLSQGARNAMYVGAGTAPDTTFNVTATVTRTGTGLPHENRQPLLALNYCISMAGVFPTFD